MKRLLHAILYCRSYSARSLEAQEERCRQEAVEEGAGTTITISDHSPTSRGMDRPGIVEMRHLLRSGRVDLVVAVSPRRLSVRLADVRALAQDASRAGARLVFLSP